MAPGVSECTQFLKIIAGSYFSAKYLHVFITFPMNFIALGDSSAGYSTASIFDLLDLAYIEGAGTISHEISPPKSVINPAWIAA